MALPPPPSVFEPSQSPETEFATELAVWRLVDTVGAAQLAARVARTRWRRTVAIACGAVWELRT